MNLQAKQLFAQHSSTEFRMQVLKANLQRLKAMEARRCQEKIEQLSLGNSWPDGMPHVGGIHRPTERVADSYLDQVQRELREMGFDEMALKQELEEAEYQVWLYHAALNALTEIEARLIHLHYEKGLSFKAMSERDLLPDRVSQYSESTLKRIHKSALCKTEGVLSTSIQTHHLMA
ncbi:hypothetical protein LJC33_04005 [Eubacteriales bacterium OttesenSCG-928-N13]|nr:hypothetical protein [Eubacteriales bacterium OttesenSCG-928-N13]